MQWYMKAVVLLATFLCPVGNPATAQESVFTETFEVARSEWYRGQDVELRFMECNTSDSPATYCRSTCPLPGWPVRIFEASGVQIAQVSSDPNSGCSPACWPEVWQPGKCETTVYQWPQIEGYFPPLLPVVPQLAEPGAYYAEAGDGSGALRTENFRLLDLPPPVPMLGGAGIAILAALMMLAGWSVVRVRSS